MYRPTSKRVRESLFGRLEHYGALDGARMLDLCAGSEALGLEAASRGTGEVVPRISVTLAVFQKLMGWLKAEAPSNMWDVDLTFDVSQESRGWLKASAPANIPVILVTLAAFHEVRGKLKDETP